MRVDVQIEGLGALGAKLEDMKRRMQNPHEAMNVAGQMIETFTIKRFSAQADPTGKPWVPLSDKTLALRRKGKRKKASPKILIDTGALRGGIRSVFPSKASVSVGVEGPARAYGATHQYGGANGKARIPRRAYLPIAVGGGFETAGPSGQLLQRIVATITKYIAGGK